MTTEIDVTEPQQLALATRPVQAIEAPPPTPLWGTSDSAVILAKATATANSLKDVVRSRGLISNISGKEYPRCEAWTLLGTLLGVFPVLCWTRQVDKGWEARVEAKTLSGAVVGAAEAQCLKTERNWGNRDDFALRSMAQTRATAKALRMPLGFVMTLAGYEATPAEEMTHVDPVRKTSAQRPAASPSAPAGPVSEPPQPVRFDEKKFRQSAETWLESERVKWVKENTNVQKWTWAVVNGLVLPTEQLSAVTWSKLWGADVLEEAVERIREGSAESAAKRGMHTRLIDRASEINREALSIGISEAEQRAFAAVYGNPGSGTAEPEKPRPPKAEARKEPSSATIPTSCPKCKSTATKTSKDYELVSWCEKCGHQWTEGGKAWEAHEWMTVPLPFAGKDKQDYVGKTLGQIARINHKYFFGITENCEYPAQSYKGKEPSAGKVAFAEACKEARDHRAANKAGAVDAMREGVAEEPDGLPF